MTKERKKSKRHLLFQWKSEYCDYNLLAIIILLTCFGLVMLYSTSAYESFLKFQGDDMHYFKRQLFFSAFALVLALFVMRFDYHYLSHVSGIAYVFSFLLMLLVRVSPLGTDAYGAQRWLNLFGIKFQPSEFAKIAVIIFFPALIVRMGKNIQKTKATWTLLILGGIQAMGAFILTDNLSTGIIIGGIAVLLIFLSQPHPKLLMSLMGIGTAIVSVSVFILGQTMTTSEDFRIRRILAWLHPEENIEKEGFQVLQSLYAIGSGGFFGKGLGNSAQKLGTIPEAQNDMILPIICEELGVFGAIILLLMFGYLLYRLYFIAQNAPDLYGTLIVSGIFIHISLQVILNVCVVVNFMPTTGITLPFVSYGGTSIVLLMMEMGIALSVSRRIKFQEEEKASK